MTPVAELTLECLAIGSLPFRHVAKALEVVKTDFIEIPFWPQLPNINKNEDMIIQFTENMPSFLVDKKILLKNEQTINDFLSDYNYILSNIDNTEADFVLDRYAISQDYSAAFESFTELVAHVKPRFAKGQVTGAYTLSESLMSERKEPCFKDIQLREVITKFIALKALWQIKKIKSANLNTTPMIFIDEPSLSFLLDAKYSDRKESEVINMIRVVSDVIKRGGALSGVHCCGKCDWSVPIKSGVNIINLNAYFFADEIDLYYDDLEYFLEHGGKIAWSVIPTSNKNMLQESNLDEMISVFENAVKYLTKKGINEKIVVQNSLITSSCGTGALSDELAEKAMRLVRELSENRKAIWHLN